MELEYCPFLARIVFSDERESFDLEKALFLAKLIPPPTLSFFSASSLMDSVQ